MGQRSAIEQDPALRDAVNAAIARGATIDDIVDLLRGAGSTVSRSSVGRYTKNYADLARRQRDISSVASAFASDFGSADDNQTRFLVQLATTISTRVAMEAATASEGDEAAIATTKQLMEFGRAVKDLTSAAKIDDDRVARIREEAARKAKAEAAAAGEQGARAAGADEATIRRVRQHILGIGS